MARSSTSGAPADGETGVHQLHAVNDTSFRCIGLIHRNDASTPGGDRAVPPVTESPLLEWALPPVGARCSGGTQAVPWPGEFATWSARWHPDLPHGRTGRVPARPQLGHPGVPQGTALSPRRVR